MSFLKEFQIASQAYGKGIGLLFHKKIRIFLLVPIILNILLFIGGYTVLGAFADKLSVFLYSLTGADGWSFWGASYFGELLSGFVHLIFKALFFLLMLFYGGYILIILLSPLFSMLSERVEILETNVSYPFTWQKFFQDIWRGFRVAIRNAFLQILLTIVVFFIGFIPFVGILAPILLFVITAYFYGFSFLDFAMERHYPTLRESVAFIRKHRVATFTNGAVFTLSLLLPLCNLFLAVFAAIWAVIAATLTLIKIRKRENL